LAGLSRRSAPASGVRIYRGGKAFGFWEIESAALQSGDTILEIVPRSQGLA
jgi:voltage-gated potassium channel